MVKPPELQDFMNYPYTRATDVIGASMATPHHLLKERGSPRRGGLNPSEIMASIYNAQYVRKINQPNDVGMWRQPNEMISTPNLGPQVPY